MRRKKRVDWFFVLGHLGADFSEIYVFDIDGVLVDVRERLKAVLRELGLPENYNPETLEGSRRRRFWSLFLSEEFLAYDKPRPVGITLLKQKIEKGAVIVLSGRPQRLRQYTIKQLSDFGVPVESVILIFRPPGDRRKDYEFKEEVLSTLPLLTEIHDDSLEVLNAAKRIHPRAKCFLHYNDTYREIT